MLALRFDFRDLFRAPRLAFALQRLWIQVVGLFVGYAAYLLLTYVSYVISGFELAMTWKRYGLVICPFSSGELLPWYGWMVYAAAVLLLVVSFLIANTAVSRATYMLAKGNHFYTWREAYRFSFRKTLSVILTPISLLVLIGLLVLGGLVIGLLGRIPYVGPLGVSFFTIFWFIAALFLLFFVIILFVSLLMVPSIIATTDEDAFEAIFQTFSLVWAQPWRLVLYQLLTIALSLTGFFVFAAFVKQALMLMNSIFASFMEVDFINLMHNGLATLQGWLIWGQSILESAFGEYSRYIYFSNSFLTLPDLSLVVKISSYFYAFSLLFIGIWVLSYLFSTYTVGNTLAFMVLKNIKDEENLLERKDKEEVEEEAEEEERTEEEETDSAETDKL